jgi:hypothetical protein
VQETETYGEVVKVEPGEPCLHKTRAMRLAKKLASFSFAENGSCRMPEGRGAGGGGILRLAAPVSSAALPAPAAGSFHP